MCFHNLSVFSFSVFIISHVVARFSIPVGTELASKAKKKEEYGAMGQQEEISVVESELSSIQELGFAFKRATSRLYEMSSPHYFTVWQSRYLT
jgi:hypothetical protein